MKVKEVKGITAEIDVFQKDVPVISGTKNRVCYKYIVVSLRILS